MHTSTAQRPMRYAPNCIMTRKPRPTLARHRVGPAPGDAAGSLRLPCQVLMRGLYRADVILEMNIIINRVKRNYYRDLYKNTKSIKTVEVETTPTVQRATACSDLEVFLT
ncbi:hypothetical protein EVAR_45349_1 [Eumeta japonica]|uniref:Uncharacterized protein n=1 Tax=Eumeta variegata TaxID=151549 RepID=A0A4C1XZD1_EUMVA|nr:hypothetical protein EVAR_45349_1 [Eumeta japonica]